MKVIKEPEKFKLTVVCKQIRDKFGYVWGSEEDYCGATLEVETTDIFKREWNKYSEKGVDYGVKCPICGSFIPVQNVPNYVKITAKEWNM